MEDVNLTGLDYLILEQTVERLQNQVRDLQNDRDTLNLILQINETLTEYTKLTECKPFNLIDFEIDKDEIAKLKVLYRRSKRGYYETDHWKSVRKKVLEYWGHHCLLCGPLHRPLVVDIHHTHYETVGCERYIDVLPLCAAHHGYEGALHNFAQLLLLNKIVNGRAKSSG